MKIIVYLMLFFSCFELLSVFSFGTHSFTPMEVLMIIFYLAYLKKIFYDGEKLIINWNSTLLFFIILIISAFLCGITPLLTTQSAMLIQYFKTFSHFLFLIFIAVICLTYPLDEKIWYGVIKMMIVLSLFVNLFGIYQLFARIYGLPLAWLTVSNLNMSLRMSYAQSEVSQLSLNYANFFRGTSVFFEPSAYAGFNVSILIYLLVPIMHGRKNLLKSKFLTYFLIILAVIGLFLAFSLSGLTGIGVLLIAMLFVGKKRKIITLIKMFIISFAILYITDRIIENISNMSVYDLFVTRVTGITNPDKSGKGEEIAGESFHMRASNITESISLWKRFPILGCGLGLTSLQTNQLVTFSSYSVLCALSEMGIFGFIGIAGLLLSLILILSKFIFFPKLFKHIPDDFKVLLEIAFYSMLITTYFNTFVGNNLVGVGLWIPLMFPISILTTYFYKYTDNSYKIELFAIPPKELIGSIISKYLAKHSRSKLQ
ncbi:MAG: hypothetical protein HW421_3578 [Ignavibacteria bacterium]|nr:hypothetical protein [Ignavibacteria bacterium]